MAERREQRVVSWDEAEQELRRLIGRAREGRDGAVVVGITGPVGSGKSTLASRLAGPENAAVVATDHYLPDYEPLPEHERDEPRHADLALLAEHLEQLRAGRTVQRPVWCFLEHRRKGSEPVAAAPLVVCEGIFALREEIRDVLDVAVYVDAPPEIRWGRWERIEASGERGWGVERARRYFAGVAEPTFFRYAQEYRRAADIVVLNPGGAPEAPPPAKGTAP